MIELTTPVGRIVGGHPMVNHVVKDDVTKQPKMQQDGITPQVQFYIGLAIEKGAETDWKQTSWGQQIVAEGAAAYPAGEFNAPTFAWKITDGDSAVPNKKGNIPNKREGYPGHWIINASNGFPIKCFHRGKFQPHEVIQGKEAIKAGDYGRLAISVKGNNPSPSPGVYVNPSMFELYQAGVEIITETSVDPNAAFGADAGVMPANAMIDPNVPAQGAQTASPANVNAAGPGGGPAGPGGPASPAQATGFANGPAGPAPVIKYQTADGQWTHAQLIAAGFDAATIATLPQV